MTKKTKKTKKKTAKAKPKTQLVEVTGTELAKLFSCTLRTIQNWKKDKGLPVLPGRNRYDLKAVIAWRMELLRVEYSSESSDDQRLTKAMADEREEKAKLTEMDRRQREGELIEEVDAQANLLERIVAVKTSMRHLSLTISKRVVGLTDEIEVEKIVEAEVYQCLLRFAKVEEQEKAEKAWAKGLAGCLSAEIGTKKTAAKIKKKIIALLSSDLFRFVRGAKIG